MKPRNNRRNNRLLIRLALTSVCAVFVLSAFPAPSVGQVAARRAQPSIRQRAAYYEPLIAETAARRGIDPRLLWTIAFLESRFNSRAVSYKDGRPCAFGLMQLIPATARRFGVSDSFDARQNLDGAAQYLRILLGMFGGEVHLALAGYNAGEGRVLQYGRRVPPFGETREYVRLGRYVLARLAQSNIFDAGRIASPVKIPEAREMVLLTAGVRQRRGKEADATLIVNVAGAPLVNLAQTRSIDFDDASASATIDEALSAVAGEASSPSPASTDPSNVKTIRVTRSVTFP
ncbi:MAG: lytic transglycosylase domain-containing protein [Pyrinomonadaceae bacterium]|nr:lytic transglycosylase domain-containing protein [Pyrinomonadaceae bacterium]